MIISSLYTMGRDQNHFTDPDTFRPERWFRNLQNIEKPNENDSSQL